MNVGRKSFKGLLFLWVFALAVGLSRARAEPIFTENFDTPGDRLDRTVWTTEFGPPSFLGRTQLQDWVRPDGVGRFIVVDGMAHLVLSTYNPTGFSLFGTHAKTRDTFQPALGETLELTLQMQLTSLQPGLVYGAYWFGCEPLTCATWHDELDIEIVTNFLQPNAPYRVQLNRYAAEPFGAGQGPIVDLPAGFDPLAEHAWTIRWAVDRVDYLVDGQELFSASDHIPSGPMAANIIAWGPSQDWSAAYDPSLQPTSDPKANRSYEALVDSVNVDRVGSAPAPSALALMLAGLAGLGVFRRRRA